MHSKLGDKQIGSARRWSLIGSGLPERIRSVGFAFLGLTAAAGLALVALFAQTGFPLLSPAPLPGGSSEPGSVSKAVSLPRGSTVPAIGQAHGAVAVSGSSSRGQESPRGVSDGDRRSAVDGSAVPVSGTPADDAPSEPVASSPPATTPTPAPPATTPTTTTEPAPEPVEVPVSSPGTGTKPGKSTAVAPQPEEPELKPGKPETKPVKPKPAKPPKSKPAKPEAAPAPEPSYVPAPAPVPADKGNDNKEKGKNK